MRNTASVARCGQSAWARRLPLACDGIASKARSSADRATPGSGTLALSMRGLLPLLLLLLVSLLPRSLGATASELILEVAIAHRTSN
jgi:hypothetical protein